ncbi:hypothetical protein NitYY0918_C0693 [Nitratiruptor sp. YY09-18]|nr:hypothetical protein NitYY0918_C0693 [Nitratiruptor sp. YY09-18]
MVVLEEPKKVQKIIPVKLPKKSGSKSATGSQSPKIKAPDIKSLFASLKIDQKTKAKEPKKSAQKPSRFKGKGGKKAQELLKKLDTEQLPTLSHHSVKAVKGKKDPYLQKVYKILYGLWLPSKESAGSRAKVLVIIDKYGNFDYKILQSSQNEIFNSELKEYLERLKQREFPIPKEKREIVVFFEAKE